MQWADADTMQVIQGKRRFVIMTSSERRQGTDLMTSSFVIKMKIRERWILLHRNLSFLLSWWRHRFVIPKFWWRRHLVLFLDPLEARLLDPLIEFAITGKALASLFTSAKTEVRKKKNSAENFSQKNLLKKIEDSKLTNFTYFFAIFGNYFFVLFLDHPIH